MKTLAKLREIVVEVIKENSDKDFKSQNVQEAIALIIEQRYGNMVKIIAQDYLQKEIDKRSTLSTFEGLRKLPVIKP